MAIGSNNPFPSVLVLEGSAPSSPSAGNQRVYIDSADHRVKRKNSGGTVRTIDGGGELDYVEFTSTVSPTATTEGTANTVVTATAITFDGVTPVVIEFFSPAVTPAANDNDFIRFVLYDGAGSIGYFGIVFNPKLAAGSSIRVPVKLERRLTPSNASHTYSVRAYVGTGTGSIEGGAGGAAAYQPGFIRITLA